MHKHAFDTATKMMATVHRRGEHFLFAVKGAPEAVLNAAQDVVSEDGDVAMDDEIRREWLQRVEHLGHHGLRVLACAMKTGRQADAAPYDGLTCVGLIGLEDPRAPTCRRPSKTASTPASALSWSRAITR